VLIIGATTQYTRAQERIFYDNFVLESDKTDIDYKRYTYIFNVKEIKDTLRRSVDVYIY